MEEKVQFSGVIQQPKNTEILSNNWGAPYNSTTQRLAPITKPLAATLIPYPLLKDIG